MFSKEEWQHLYEKCKPEKFKNERSSIERGRSFYTAFKTPMGDAIESHIVQSIQSCYEAIDSGNINMDDIYQMNVYRVIDALWNKRRLDYKGNIERVKKLIYKGEKK